MSSPSYFNYDTFDEINFSTGGSDISQSAGGMGIGMVSKRGTNAYHGSAGGYFTHDDLQSSNLPDELVVDPRLQGNDKADHTEQISDYSFDLGRPNRHRSGSPRQPEQLKATAMQQGLDLIG